MSTRINNIIEIVTSVNSPATFWDLDMECQTYLIYEAARFNFGQVKFWTERLEDETTLPHIRERAKTEVPHFSAALRNQLVWLQGIGHYVEAGDSYLTYDNASYNSETGTLESDDMHSERTAVAKHPHAWAQANLVAKGFWPMVELDNGDIVPEYFEPTDDLPSLEGVAQSAKRVAGRFISAVVTSVYENDGMYVPSRTAGRDILMSSISPVITGLSNIKNRLTLERQILELIKSNPSFGKTGAAMVGMWRDMADLDEDDAQIAEIDAAVKDVKLAVKDVVMDIRKQLAIELGVSQLTKIGASDELVASAKAKLEKAFNVNQVN